MADAIFDPPPLINPWILLFRDKYANREFRKLQNIFMAKQDRWFMILALIGLSTIMTTATAWSLPLLASYLALLVIWGTSFWLSSMRCPTTHYLYSHYRPALVLFVRLLNIQPIKAVYNSSRYFSRSPCSGPALVHHFVLSRTANLFFVALGLPLPFWQHMLVQPALVAIMIWSGMLRVVASSLCECCSSGVLRVEQWLSHTAMTLQPMEWDVVTKAEEGAVEGVCNACPAMQLLVFVQLVVGLLVPSVVLFKMEWAARMRFVMVNVNRFQFGGEEGVAGLVEGESWWWVVVVSVVQIVLGAMTLWLTMVYVSTSGLLVF